MHDFITFIHIRSYPDAGGNHDSGEETNLSISNALYDRLKPITIPHQTSASGDVYAVSTRKKNWEQTSQKQVEKQVDTGDTKKESQGVSGFS